MERALQLVRLAFRAARTWVAAASLAIVALAAGAFLISPRLATAATMPHVEVADGWSYGPYFRGPDPGFVLLASHTVRAPVDASWIRVHFSQFQVADRDYVRLIGDDGHGYEIQGREVEHGDLFPPVGNYYSLFFTGSSITIELYAEQDSHGNGITVDFFHYGTAPAGGGSESNCNLEQVDGRDNRIGRLIALQQWGATKSYQVCSATLLFPGDCVVTDGSCLACPDPDFVGEYVPCLERPGIVDFEDSGSLIVEFDVPASLGNPLRGAIQHPGLGNQYRLLTTPTPCVDESDAYDSKFAVFVAAPNELNGFSPSAAFAAENITYPVGGELVVVEGFPGRLGEQNHIQTRDDSEHLLSDVFCDERGCTEGVFLTSNRSVWDGSEGSPIMSRDGRKLYAILNEPGCIYNALEDVYNLVAPGHGFDQDGIDPEADGSCVSRICKSSHGYVGWPRLCLAADGGPCHHEEEWSCGMHLPNFTLQMAPTGTLVLQGGAPIFRGDRRLEIDLEMVSLDLAAVSCLGPVSIELDPTRPSRGTFRQAAAGAVYPAENFFDVFLKIQVGGATYTNRDPLRLSATVSSLPPYDVLFTGPTGPLALYDAQGALAGSLENVQRVTRRPRDCAFSSLKFSLGTLGPLSAGGTYQVVRGATRWDPSAKKWSVPTEIVAMDLRGISPPTGHYVIRESPTRASLGAALFDSARVIPGAFPAQGFFDVFVEIELTDQGRTLVNHDPLRLAGTIRGFPPTGDTLTALGGVQLFDRDTGQPAEFLQQVLQLPEDPLAWIPPPPPGTDAYCAQGRMILDLGQGITTVDALSGGLHVARSAAVEQPNGMAIEPMQMTLLGLHKDATPFGPMDVRVQRTTPSTGSLQQTEQGTFFPALAFFDVFLEIATPQGVLHNAMPLRLSKTLNSVSEPEPDPYQSATGFAIPLLTTGGTPAGTLYAMWLYPGIPYDPSCPGVVACGSSTVGVADPAVDPSIRSLRLGPILPNPSKGRAQIAFDVPVSGVVRVQVHDVAGRVVKTLADGWRSGPQRHRIAWDGTDALGLRARSGVYFVTLDAGRQHASTKLLMLR